MINGYAVNSSALASWVKAAVVAATATASCALSVTFVCGGASTPSANGAAIQVVATRIKPGAVVASGQGQGYLLPYLELEGRATLTGSCSSLAACERWVWAEAVGSATVTAFAVADSEVGAAEASATLSGEAGGHRVRPGAATLTADADSALAGVVYGQTVTVTLTSAARVEASVKRNGENFYRHDGYVLDPLGQATASVAVSYLELQCPLAAAISATATPYRTRPAGSILETTATSAAAGIRGTHADAARLAVMTASATPLRSFPGAATATAQASKHALTAHYGRSGAAAASGGVSYVTARYRVDYKGGAAGASTGQGTAGGDLVRLADAAATGSASTAITVAASNPTSVSLAAGLTALVPSSVDRPAAAAGKTSVQFTLTGFGTQHWGVVAGDNTADLAAVTARSNPSLVYGYVFAISHADSQAVFVGAVTATATATAAPLLHATQQRAAATSSATAACDYTENGITRRYAGAVSTTASAALHQAAVARSNPTTVSLSGQATATAASQYAFVGSAAATGDIRLTTCLLARSNLMTVALDAGSMVVAQGEHSRLASATAEMTATGRANGLLRSETAAPPSRSLIVPYEPRGLLVPAENRTMVVPA